eukprot:768802-Hanusia_phi.AAC.8
MACRALPERPESDDSEYQIRRRGPDQGQCLVPTVVLRRYMPQCYERTGRAAPGPALAHSGPARPGSFAAALNHIEQ